MILVTHAVGGGALAIALARENPFLALAVGFVSHFVLDAVPHWHYELRSFEKSSDDPRAGRFVFDRRFAYDLARIAVDCGAGVFITLAGTELISPGLTPIAFLGALGGVLPDLFQFTYYLSPKTPMKYLQRFHHAVHAKTRLDDDPAVGISSQALIGASFFFILLAYSVLRLP